MKFTNYTSLRIRKQFTKEIKKPKPSSSAQFKYFKTLVGSIKNDLTNYRQYVESSQIGDVESEDIRLVKLKGRAIECI